MERKGGLCAGKRSRRPPIIACAAGTRARGEHLFVYCTLTAQHFLIECGAQVSTVPPAAGERCSASTHRLVAANHSSINTYGTKSLTLKLAGRFTFTWKFIIADLKYPILGSDFLRNAGLVVDVTGRRLLDRVSLVSIPLQPSRSPDVVGILTKASNEFEALLLQFPSVLTPRFDADVKHKVQHHMVTKGPPRHAKARRLAPDVLREVKEEFRSLGRLGIIKKVTDLQPRAEGKYDVGLRHSWTGPAARTLIQITSMRRRMFSFDRKHR